MTSSAVAIAAAVWRLIGNIIRSVEGQWLYRIFFKVSG
jgi:hypothetical protein